jgi:hypothetical protein
MRKYGYKTMKGKKRLLYTNNNAKTKYIMYKGSFIKLNEFQKVQGGFGKRETRSTVSQFNIPNELPKDYIQYNRIASHKTLIVRKLMNIDINIYEKLKEININDKYNLSEKIPLLESKIKEYNNIKLQFQKDNTLYTMPTIDIESLDIDEFSEYIKKRLYHGGSKKDNKIELKITNNIENIKKNIKKNIEKNMVMINKYFIKSVNEYPDPILLDKFIIILRDCQNIIHDLKNIIIKQLKQRRKELGTVRHVLYKLNPFMDKVYKHNIQVLTQDILPNSHEIQQERNAQLNKRMQQLKQIKQQIPQQKQVQRRINKILNISKPPREAQEFPVVRQTLPPLSYKSSTIRVARNSGRNRIKPLDTEDELQYALPQDVFDKMSEPNLLAQYLGKNPKKLDAELRKELQQIENDLSQRSSSSSSSSALSRLTSMSTSRSNSKSKLSRSRSSRSSLS